MEQSVLPTKLYSSLSSFEFLRLSHTQTFEPFHKGHIVFLDTDHVLQHDSKYSAWLCLKAIYSYSHIFKNPFISVLYWSLLQEIWSYSDFYNLLSKNRLRWHETCSMPWFRCVPHSIVTVFLMSLKCNSLSRLSFQSHAHGVELARYFSCHWCFCYCGLFVVVFSLHCLALQ